MNLLIISIVAVGFISGEVLLNDCDFRVYNGVLEVLCVLGGRNKVAGGASKDLP